MKNKVYVYDIEIFPNFFSATFIDRDSDDKREFMVYENTNELLDMSHFITAECAFLVGYNSSKYDDIIINYIKKNQINIIIKDGNEITNELYDLSQKIIGSQKGGKSIYWNEDLKPYLWSNYYTGIDLMSLMAFDKNRVSLKQAGIAMRWHKIQDLPKPFDEPVFDSEIDIIMDYNINDVEMTKELLRIIMSEIKIRKDVGDMYGLKLWSSSRSNMADKLTSKFWSDATGAKYQDFRQLRTEYNSIKLSDCISDKVKFSTPKMQVLLDKIKSTVLLSGDKFKETIIIGESKYDMLLGGLHSHNPAMVVEDCDEYELHDADFGSYYPNLMINEGAYPKHLSKEFLVLFKKLVTQRLDAKANGDKVVANALKIVINSTYGKLLFEHSWLYDSMAGYKVTLNGQLYLLMLIEKLEQEGFSVYYANTDGFMTKVPKGRNAEYEKICKMFENYVNIPLEFEKYKKCTIRDVNNFTMTTIDGKIKEKGVFVRDKDVISTFLRPNYTCSYDMPIVSLALYEYFVNNKSIEETIKNHKNIYDFCKAQKIGGQFNAEYHTLDKEKGNLKVTKCQKTNRYYVSTTQGKFYKNKDGALHDLCAGYNVEIFNNYVKKDNYNINYNYYISATQKIIDVMEPIQLTLF
jgi:hypothetical protein